MQPGYVHELFDAVAVAYPERVAIELPDRGLTYGELRMAVGAVATSLVANGVREGDRVGVFLADRAAVATAILAVLHVGCAFVPVDPGLPDARLRLLFEAADCACVLVDPSLVERVLACGASRPISLASAGAATVPPPPLARWAPDGLCYLFFTSGSTGAPKAIAGRLCAIDHFIRWEAAFVGATEATGAALRVSQLTTPSFDAFLRDLFLPLCTGGTMCIPPDGTSADAALLPTWLTSAEVSVLHCVPSVFRVLLDAGLDASSLPSLRHVLLAGEVLRPEDARRWLSAIGERIKLVNLYGPSETTMVKLFHVVCPEDLSRPSIPVGCPMPGAEVVLLGDDGAPVRDGEIGEIAIRTNFASLGYFRQPALTARVFLPEGLYLTGDHGRLLEGGALSYLGRRDRQVKLRGVRVELDEVELTLRRCAGVIDAAVDVRAEGDGPSALLAWAVLLPDANVASIAEELATLLPAAMIPAVITGVAALPRTMTGKVDRRALRDPRVNDRTRTPPASLTERSVASMWEALLGVAGVGREDNFFALGGHSLLAAQLVARVRAAFGVQLTLSRVLQQPTLAQIASAIDEAERQQDGGVPPADLSPIARLGDVAKPLSFSQTTMWTMDRLIGPTGALNLFAGHELRGPLDIAALERAVRSLHARHPMLKARFCVEGGELVQRVDASLAAPWSCVDLRGVPDDARAAHLEARTGALIRASLLGSAPVAPWTATLFLLADDQARLVLVLHHIISDGASLSILCRELGALYAGLPLPALAVEYADYAAWLRGHVSGERLRALLEHETGRLGGRAEYLELPVDRPQSLIPDLAGGLAQIELPSALLAPLVDLSRNESATLFMVLQSAFQLTLGAMCGSTRVLVPTPVAARPRPELEGVVGMFMNVVVIGVDRADDPTFREFLRRVRADALDAFDHEALPFELLTEALPAGTGSRHPLVQVAFNLQNMGSLDLTLTGVAVERASLESGVATFDLGLILDEGPRGIVVSARYASALFDDATIASLLASYRSLLEAIASSPDAHVSQLPLPERRPAATQPIAPTVASPAPVSGFTLRPLPRARLVGEPPPLFFVPPVGGGSDCYRGLAERLPRPSFSLSADETFLPVAERAAVLTADIRRARPEGPYALAAWSLGGPLAIEIARQLIATPAADRRSGRERVMVALLDAPCRVEPRDVDAFASRQLAHLALHRVWSVLPGVHGDEITSRIDAALSVIASGEPPAALAALFRATRFALGAPDAGVPDEEDRVTLGILGNVFGRQLGLIAPAKPGAELDARAMLGIAVGAAAWLGVIDADAGQIELIQRVMSLRSELDALRRAASTTLLPEAALVLFTPDAATIDRGLVGPHCDVIAALGGHLGMLSPLHVERLAQLLESRLAGHFDTSSEVRR